MIKSLTIRNNNSNFRPFLVLFKILMILLITSPLQGQREGFTVFGDSLKIVGAFSFSPDGKHLYTSEPKIIAHKGSKAVYARWNKNKRLQLSLYVYDLDGNTLSNKRQLPFANDSLDSSPHVNFEGNRIYFNSRRPVPGSTELDGKGHVWYSEKTMDGWSDAKYISEINQKGYWSAYCQELKDGSLIFQSNIQKSVAVEEESSSLDFWKSDFINGQYQKPRPIDALNSKHHEDQIVVDQEESFVIFTRVEGDEMTAHISQKKGEKWTTPRELHLTSETGFKEQSPRLSPDGKTFFFAHGTLVMSIPLKEILTSEECKELKIK